MDKEICYRLFRIILVVFIFLCFIFLREVVKESYVEANEIENNMNNSLVMEKVVYLENEVDDSLKYYSYSFKVTNDSSILKKGDIVFSSDEFLKQIKYQVLKDNKVLKNGSLKEDDILYSLNLNAKSSGIYEVRFLIDENDNIDNLNGKIELI